MDQAKKSIDLQEDRLEQIQRAQTNYLKSPKTRITLSYVETRLESLEKIQHSFNCTHEEIATLIPRSQRTSVGYFTSNLYEKFDEIYTTYKTTLKEKIKELANESESSSVTHNPSRTTTNSEIKLPTINIPAFSGKYTDWPSFKDLFTSIIHKNTTLEDVQKLHYLKSLVAGEAEQLLRSVTVTNQNYIPAWDTLCKRYNNKRYIANNIFKKLFGIKKLNYESGHLLKQLLDTTTECLSSLNNIGIDTETWDSIIIYLTITKLDPISHRLWEQQISSESNELPSFEALSQFLEMRFKSLEMVEDYTKPSKPKTFHVTTSEHSVKCAFCKGDHYIFQCKQFAKQGHKERTDFVKENKLCFNCLIPNHSANKCLRGTCCKICKRKHHSLLHPEKRETDTLQRGEIDTQEKENINTHFVTQPGQVLLATALVDVSWKNKHIHIYRALIDQGSQASFVTEDLVQSAGLKRIKINGVVSGLSEGSQLRTNYLVELKIRSRFEPHFTLFVKAYVLKKITNYLPSQQCIVNDWPELKSITLADPTFNVPNKIDILLGAEVYAEIINDGLLKSHAGIVAQNTRLGWILSGQTSNIQPETHRVMVNMHICDCDNTLLRKFWEIESETNSSDRKQTKDEIRCEEIYKNTTIKTKGNRYKVYLPFKEGSENPVEWCGDTKEVALSRFLQLEKRFKRDKSLREEYTKVIHEYLDLGHMKQANDNTEKSIYLPHHAVIRNDKDTTKTRVVFDASAKGSKGCSLNDTLLIGPTLQQDLRTLIMKWRQYRIVLVGDLVKMYRQVLVTEEHTDYQRIVWRDHPDEEFKSYRLLTVTFGTASAPYLAVRTLLRTAEDNGEKFPLAANITKTSFYMDDLLTGCYSIEEGVEIYHQMNALLETGGFELRKWCSNSNELLTEISKDKQHLDDTYEIKFDEVTKILGLVWDRTSDEFKFSVNLSPISETITKRKILSDIARLFDPFGWLAPIIVTAKIFLQRLWLLQIGWDDPVPLRIIQEWKGYRNEVNKLQNLKLDRWINTYQDRRSVELHGFADASTLAYAAVIYVKVTDDKGEAKITLLESKTKVAPLKQISIARLELCGALLLAKLLSQATTNLNIPKDQVYAYTDSTVTLAWIEGQPTKWQTFVANRVAEIQTLLDNSVWSFVASNENPADLASRGLQADDLIVSQLWWEGPSWLKNKLKITPKNHTYTTNLEERKIKIKNYHCELEENAIYERFSSLNKMKRVLTYCRRFLHRKNKEFTTYLNTEELKETMQMCIKLVQSQVFIEELNDLKEKGSVKKRSKLLTLSPYLDNNQILRVGGRLQGAKIPAEIKHPIILPKDNYLTWLIVKDAHIRLLHGGNRLMTNYLQNQYWILGLKPLVKKCVRQCVVCIRHKGITLQPQMGEIPSARITPGRPFKTSGVDFAGPIQMRTYKGRGHKSFKGYISLFVCMKTKAVHLEAVSDLTSQGFIAAFRRFISRRGHCSDIWSDNGLNFVGAAKELKNLFNASIFTKEIAELLANDGTTWHFIPPKAPNFGGLWEAAIKSVKTHLIKVTGNSTLTFEEMTTLLTQIEACLNSRPICSLNDHPDDLMCLTPAHFLIGETTMITPEPVYENITLSSLDRWTLIQKMIQHFWKRWSTEYLQRLQQRNKWQKTSNDPKVGQIVIIKDDDLPPAKWLMGRIESLIAGPDDIVRVARLRCKSSILTRPVSKLILLNPEA